MSATEYVETGSRRGRLAVWLARELRGHLATYVTLISFVLIVVAVATLRGDTLVLHIAEYAGRIVRVVTLVASALIALACTIGLLKARNGESPASIAVASLRAVFLSSISVRFLYACAVLAIFMGAFLYCKMLIPEIQPFSWDSTFAEWDRIIFGTDPWRLLYPLLGTPWITFPLDFVYSSWVPAIFVFWAGLTASPRVPDEIRSQYWLATVFSWILIGLVMATAFSSAGPCYFAEVVPGIASPYAELLSHIREMDALQPLSSSSAKAFLWDVYSGNIDLPGGISAMPSMHNAQAALMAAAAYRLNRGFGHAMTAYAVLIFIGSIHLGWHYAVDGMVGVAAALAIWSVCGAFLGRRVKALA